MTAHFDDRRYLTDFDSARTGNILTDVLVIGSGVAGIRAAIEAAQSGSVILMTKRGFDESATWHAQGGIAAALGPNDSPDLHFRDTMKVGCGLNDPEAVRLLVTEGPARLQEVIAWGFDLDRDQDEPALGTEGGHSVSRVAHAHGDQTGRELVRALKERLSGTANVRVFEHCFLIDFITIDEVCRGAVTFHDKYGHQLIWAKQTILASGGCGQLWRETTNPTTATGDGLAAAYRAGAVLRDLELMQFHPTTLYVAGAGRALISEAVRGEGAHLVDRAGRRFMDAYHPDAELAPRDVVSRAIHEQLLKLRTSCVYLDVRAIPGFCQRFPLITKLCADFEIDVTRTPIPVHPSAHYMVGGVVARLDGSTCVDGLLCCGEAASTGVHGANRMASNSLLEGLVFGKLAGRTAAEHCRQVARATPVDNVSNSNPRSARTKLDLSDIRNSLRSVMWRNVGIVRHGDRLKETCDILDFWGHYTLDKTFNEPAGWEMQNKLTLARLVAMSALARTESLGVHYREDDTGNPNSAPYHVSVNRDPANPKPVRVPLESGNGSLARGD
ncbi:MAG: L-aspartate oxidase [Planctomycetes bacterium]|nr:L-aspartate oxidase [Planctomycetota bacterium]